MSLTAAHKLRGILPVVISGGRPQIRQRPTAGYLQDLHGITADPIWIVAEKDAAAYERDGHEIAAYPREWAEEYAASHWTALKPPEPGGFLGAFPGREWACRLAEERGCWAALQLDDNIIKLSCFRDRAVSSRLIRSRGGLGIFADVLAAVTLSTNGWMTGARLASAPRDSRQFRVSRKGFPYSLFLERTGPGREAWYGPFEDDITHAYQYGSSASAATALIVPALLYKKETSSKTGMRGKYNGERAVPLQRMFPETAKVGINRAHSNGRGDARVFHRMSRDAIRTPQAITDHDLYSSVNAYLAEMAREYGAAYQQELRAQLDRRAARA